MEKGADWTKAVVPPTVGAAAPKPESPKPAQASAPAPAPAASSGALPPPSGQYVCLCFF